MPSADNPGATLVRLDRATVALVRLSAALAANSEEDIRPLLQAAADLTPHEWVEELMLQTYLFAGFPRALNGMREWRRIAPTPANPTIVADGPVRPAGEDTCRRVYGTMYERLRVNIRELHPLLDAWMIDEGYGKVLSRPGLDLPRRELCIVAACAASGQDRQLQSHLHGARNVGVPQSVLTDALSSLEGVVSADRLGRARRIWNRIQ